MAIDIVTIKNACQNMQNEADRYENVKKDLQTTREECGAEKLEVGGSSIDPYFEELIETVNAVKTSIIDAGTAVYNEAKAYYQQQKEWEEAQAAGQQGS